MAAGETFKASVIGELDDHTAVVFDFGYADVSAGNNHFDTGTAAGAFQTLVQASIKAAMPDDWQVRRYRFACVGGAHVGEIGYVEVEADTVVGELSAVNRMPNELCASIKRSTGYASRRDRGRLFFGPLALVHVDNSDVNKVVVGDFTSIEACVKAPLGVGSFVLQPVILAANGTYSGRIIINSSTAPVMTHRKTRRPRVGA